jgi:hypothetical protein
MKGLAVTASVVAVVAVAIAYQLFVGSYERVCWSRDALVRQTAQEWGNPLAGVWAGTFYYMHDCGPNGCETREQVQLTVRPDSTARLVVAVDTLDMIYVPFTDVVFARPSLWIASADEVLVRPDKLVMAWDTSYTVPYEVRGDSLVADLGAHLTSF